MHRQSTRRLRHHQLEEESGGAAADRHAKEKGADLEARLARMARDKAALEEQLAEERANRQEVRRGRQWAGVGSRCGEGILSAGVSADTASARGAAASVVPQLEETLKDKLDRAGDDEAAETVAAFEVKYNRLKERYKVG